MNRETGTIYHHRYQPQLKQRLVNLLDFPSQLSLQSVACNDHLKFNNSSNTRSPFLSQKQAIPPIYLENKSPQKGTSQLPTSKSEYIPASTAIIVTFTPIMIDTSLTCFSLLGNTIWLILSYLWVSMTCPMPNLVLTDDISIYPVVKDSLGSHLWHLQLLALLTLTSKSLKSLHFSPLLYHYSNTSGLMSYLNYCNILLIDLLTSHLLFISLKEFSAKLTSSYNLNLFFNIFIFQLR